MVKFRTATTNDSLAIAGLVNSAYRGDYSKLGWTTEADILGGQRTDIESIQKLITEQDSQIELALDENGEILGCVHLVQENQDMLYFGMLTVEPSTQNRGIGKALLNHLESKARSKRLYKIRMTVIQLREELIAFYERRGYKATGVLEPFPENDPLFGSPKVAGLKFMEFIKELTKE